MGLVVVADDDADIRELVRFALDLVGLTAIPVADGDAALVACHEHRPDAVLLDVSMPGSSGLEVCRTLKDASPELPVLLLTARAEESDAEEGYAAGAVDYVVKPFSPRDLAERVQAVLARTGR
jgi:two-component system response regulator MtrA